MCNVCNVLNVCNARNLCNLMRCDVRWCCNEVNVCMYECLSVCLYVRTYVCMYVCMFACMYVRTYVSMYVCTYVSIYICMYIYIYINIGMYTIGLHQHMLSVRQQKPRNDHMVSPALHFHSPSFTQMAAGHAKNGHKKHRQF